HRRFVPYHSVCVQHGTPVPCAIERSEWKIPFLFGALPMHPETPGFRDLSSVYWTHSASKPRRLLPAPPSHRHRHAHSPANRLRQTPRRSEEHTSELQSRENLVCRLLL